MSFTFAPGSVLPARGLAFVSPDLLVISEWGCMGDCQGDVNGDNQVESMDILLVIEHWS